MADDNLECGTPFDKEAFMAMSPEARDWHIMAEIYQIKKTCVRRGLRIVKLENKRKADTGLAVIVGAVAGFFGAIFKP